MKTTHAGTVGAMVAVVAACAYLVADAGAKSLASGFATAETARHARSVELNTKIMQAPADYWTEARYRTPTKEKGTP
jgi:hypothetical protein